ncbi:MAG: hypothetical protein PHO91_03985 [Patescibacteria group bacterium]|nr:hypothetical protein [Patescibacteria group bacterium]
MSGIPAPWSEPVELLVEHNNGETGLSLAGEKIYDLWQSGLHRPLRITPDNPAKNQPSG